MKDATRLTVAGRHPFDNFGAVNPPVYHASTILFPTLDALDDYEKAPVKYGRHGTPGTFALQDAICELENGSGTLLMPSGACACATAIMAAVQAGDHLLVTDSIYAPVRTFCDQFLTRFGVEVSYYDPRIGANIASLLKPNTAAVMLESPGSLTFEVQDIPAIVAAVRAKCDAMIIADNTWATPLFFKPLDFGVDLSIQAATKYVVGHADAMLGTVTATKESYGRLRKAHRNMGLCAGPDDVYLALRGLRTMAVRLKQHWQTGLKLAEWLNNRPEVERVLHPALPGDPGHEIWKRDFKGACGLFGFVLKHGARDQVAAMVDHLKFFKMGYSWGGFESLIVPSKIDTVRTATTWQASGPTLRIHAGLEDPDDLIADLDEGFKRFNAA